MGCLFSHKQEAPPPSRVNQNDKTVAQLKITRDEVKRYERKLENNIKHYKEAVKECVRTKNKQKALIVLKKQKYLEKNLETTRGELLNLEQMINDVEGAQIQKNLIDALKQGNDLLKHLNSQVKLDDVERVMAETQEAIEYQNEVSEALSRQGFVTNDDDLLEELESLEALEYDLPEAPKNPLVVQEKAKQPAKQQERQQERQQVLEHA